MSSQPEPDSTEALSRYGPSAERTRRDPADLRAAIHRRAAPVAGRRLVLSPADSASEELSLELWRLGPGEQVEDVAENQEAVVVILGGKCSAAIEGGAAWRALGQRRDVFDGAATSIYVPPGTAFRVGSEAEAELAVVRAPATPGGEPYVIHPSEVRREERGRGAWRRQVHTILDQSRPAQRLLVGETCNQPGAWSSYPPHKHDRHDPPRESRLQEVYHFRLQPRQGFGIQRLYSPQREVDEAIVVQDGDTVLLPFGYHPVVAAAGYRLYYLWALAGDGRRLDMFEDPSHRWVTSED